MNSKQKLRYWAIVPAAGAGKRFGGLAKQYQLIAGKPMLERTLEPLLANPEIDKVMVALAADDSHWSQLSVSNHPKILTCVGGAERADSVLCGLTALQTVAQPDDWVLVHDAARPCLRAADLERLLTDVADSDVGGLLATPVADTLKRETNHQVKETLAREHLWQAQTPQMFRFGMLRTALQQAQQQGITVTDEAMAVEALGQQPLLVQGSRDNIKITYPEDKQMAEQFFSAQSQLRIGHGYDVHQLGSNRKLIMGGVEIPHHLGLIGHSDADVVLHALCDALLGAAGLGDIGQHFPDTDATHKNRDSREFLRDIYRKIQSQGYCLVNADVTIIAQAPKLAQYLPTMRAHIAEDCETVVDCINVKATTTERLGFVGREEGIACEAVVLLKRS
ncbi:MAG: 2-C-methyl-D-erythritol 4-phosphate cytidylyltransferase [Gammaproteobacteria bacterium]|nr:2-C-methyl-D-erythritol 4-phosphate cytidylyltransferase [Gammaproteobacteria bacterium]